MLRWLLYFIQALFLFFWSAYRSSLSILNIVIFVFLNSLFGSSSRNFSLGNIIIGLMVCGWDILPWIFMLFSVLRITSEVVCQLCLSVCKSTPPQLFLSFFHGTVYNIHWRIKSLYSWRADFHCRADTGTFRKYRCGWQEKEGSCTSFNCDWFRKPLQVQNRQQSSQ